MTEPSTENEYLSQHAELLISSYRRLTGKDLVEPKLQGIAQYRALYNAPYGLLSHNTEDDPLFTYANKTAQKLFEMSWSEFIGLPSRKSAEPINRAERKRLLDRVTNEGFIDDYSGIRISSTGVRFWIKDATVWNMIDEKDIYHGQGAVFHQWALLENESG